MLLYVRGGRVSHQQTAAIQANRAYQPAYRLIAGLGAWGLPVIAGLDAHRRRRESRGTQDATQDREHNETTHDGLLGTLVMRC